MNEQEPIPTGQTDPGQSRIVFETFVPSIILYAKKRIRGEEVHSIETGQAVIETVFLLTTIAGFATNNREMAGYSLAAVLMNRLAYTTGRML